MQALRAVIIGGCLALATMSSSAQAQTELATSNFQYPTADQVVGFLTVRLGLSDDQRGAIGPIIAERQGQLKALLAEPDEAQRAKLRQVRAIMSSSDARINAVLSADQQKKYADLEVEIRQRLRQRLRGE